MINNVAHISFDEIPHLSSKDKLYQSEADAYHGFYKYSAKLESFGDVISERKKFNNRRDLLVNVLLRQYESESQDSNILSVIKSLRDENTFTVTTAHQPVLFLGPLYVVYKILSTIHLSQILKEEYPDFNFVPVFVSGGEDHDLEEVATMHIFNRDITWKTGQTGSVGRMSLADLEDPLTELIDLFGQSPYAEELESIIRKSLAASNTYGEFNINLYKSLFTHLGLVVLNMDDRELKKELLPYTVKEIESKISFKTVTDTQIKLAGNGIKEQAHVREINLFSFGEGTRDRIIEGNGQFSIGEQNFSKDELIEFISKHPENISPNVVMRPIYQELILPNLAYIGGGGEIAYWLERLDQFASFDIPFPVLVRRNSAMIVNANIQKNLNKVDLKSKDFFRAKDDLIKYYLSQNTEGDYSLQDETEELELFFKKLAAKAKTIDPSLEKYTLAEGAKHSKILKSISNKMTKAAKNKNEVQLQKVQNIQSKLFPHGKLQERYDNFIPYYLKYGKAWFDALLVHLNPMDKDFIIIEE